ncbi:MAG: DUF4974 domain-containing protein [Tannerellaceae bacterium]|jgi:ferric-dicitrate binding protein FerR (iron transport regulator)|nr:DUF4974 domain-containing protein [Tannerellaceae bacterium]
MPEEMHNKMEELIVRYLQQDIREDELRELDLWLEESEENRDCFFQMKNIYDSNGKRKLMSEREIEESWQNMQRKMREAFASLPPAPKKRSFLRHALRYAAAVAAAFLLGAGFNQYLGKYSPQAHDNVPVYNEISVPRGGKTNTLLLSDGSKVLLNAATTFRYPTTFAGDVREVCLDGEAYFEVAKDAQKPFVVKLKQQNILVHGTSFNIEAYRGESYNIVTLVSGSISLESLDGNGEEISNIFLKPGQKAYFDNAAGIVSVKNVDASLSNSWIKGEYKFKDESLGLIAKRLENYYDVNIHLDHAGLENIRYTGTFSFSQSIQEVLRIINHEKQFLFQQTGNEIHIKSKQ